MMRSSIVCLLALAISACAMTDINFQNPCNANEIESLRAKAWKADYKGDDTLSKKYFSQLCNCSDLEGCLNAVRYYDESSEQSHALVTKACDLGDGTSCFELAEKLSGDAAKGYYEKGCTFTNNFRPNGMACRMAGKMNKGAKRLYYLEKGCELGDEVACIEVWPMIKNDPIKKEKYKKLGCDLGIPEVCHDKKRARPIKATGK